LTNKVVYIKKLKVMGAKLETKGKKV